MVDTQIASEPTARRVGPPVLLAQRPKFMARVVTAAQLDKRIRALAIWGQLARGDADEWSEVEYVLTVADDAVAAIVDEISQVDSPFGRSLLVVSMPQRGVEGGAFLSMIYLQSGLPIQVDWYICPVSLGLHITDTKSLFSHEPWPAIGTAFADLLRDRPSRASLVPLDTDLSVAQIPLFVKEVARGNFTVVDVDGKPASDQFAAYDELGRQIGALPSEYSDLRSVLFYYLGVARRGVS